MNKFFLVLLLAGGAHAQTLDFNDGTLSGEIVLAAPLADGTQTVTPTSFAFDPFTILNSTYQNLGEVNYLAAGYVNSAFTFTTVNGAITGWNIALSGLEGLYPDSRTTQTLTLTQSGDSYQTISCDGACVTTQGTPSAGGWTTKTAQLAVSAPEIGSDAAASMLTLLFGSLCVLRGRRRLDQTVGVMPSI